MRSSKFLQCPVAAAVMLAVTVAPGAAAASNHLCATSAKILARSPHLTITDFSQQHQSGVALHGSSLVAHHFYDVEKGTLKIRYQGNDYRVGPAESVIALRCYGQSRSQPANLPSLGLFEGSVTATVSRDQPGAVETDEGLYGPIPGATLSRGYTFDVVRKLRKKPDLTQAVMWFAGLAGRRAVPPSSAPMAPRSSTSLRSWAHTPACASTFTRGSW